MTGRADRAADQRELVITRLFDAPRSVVWRAWTDPEQVKSWGPRGFTTTEREMEFRPGGAWHAVMVSPEGQRLRQHGVVQEVVQLERLVFTFIWDDHPEEEMLVSVSFVDRGQRTEMVFRQTGFSSDASRDGHRGGWNEAFDQLAETLAVTTR